MRLSVKSTFILCNFHVCKWNNAYIKDLNALRILMNFLCIYLGEKRGGCTNACICMGTHNQPLLPNRLYGCLRNLVGMKCSWSLTNVVVFRPYPPRGGSRAEPK